MPPTTDEALAQALEPFQGDSELARQALAALAAILPPDVGIQGLEDRDILAQDTVHLTRLNYVLALMRQLRFLKREPADFKEAHAQASLAQSIVKGSESSQLALMQLGRQKSDADLAKAVAQQQGELKRLAAAMAEKAAK